jgi:phosphopantothenoylcysteine decarboxylase
MNTLMWEHPLTRRHLRELASDAGARVSPTELDPSALIDEINRACPQLRIVAPLSKRLACGDVGVGGLAEVEDIVAAVESQVGGRA